MNGSVVELFNGLLREGATVAEVRTWVRALPEHTRLVLLRDEGFKRWCDANANALIDLIFDGE